MKIVILDRLEEEVVGWLRDIGEVSYLPPNPEVELEKAEVLIVRSRTKVTRSLMEKAKRLRLIARAGVGLDNIDVDFAREKNIKVINTPDSPSNAVAELTIGHMLSLLRNIAKAHCEMKKGVWDKKHLIGQELEGKTLGIIGYGRIGSLVGKKAHCLGMKILAFNPPPRHEDGIAVFVDDFDLLLKKADIITLHLPLTPKTKGMINKESISKMKDGVYLINTSRGDIVDEEALYHACKSGKIAGAALDVFSEEPYKGKLSELPNVLLTPHLGSSTKEAQLRIGKELIERIKKEK